MLMNIFPVLRGVARLQEELRTVRAQYQDLTDEYQILQESNTIMVHQLERLEAIKYRTRTKSDDSQSFDSDSDSDLDTVNPHIRRVSIARRNTLQSGGSVSFKSVEIMGVGSEYDDDKMEKLEEESEYDLQCQLEKEEKKVELVQAQHDPPQDSLYVREIKSQASHTDRKSRVKEKKKKDVIEEREEDENKCDQAQHSLRELEGKCQLSQTEWEQLHEELRLCKEEIERLNGTIPIGGRVPRAPDPPIISLPFIGLVVIVALLWCWWAETSS
ncbi:coiled-coil domain-containing protein 136-like isoform X2 [Sceloporus undulatus]|uniref:coiled-coil domain-containing protein 136-like isoform X2 n=1 Tax=Sceloporus undulatus TaxID=8520 RepID=UPI001C4DD88A|nr:coiled-coil domain-containing protein 136-like isoform X2 [Sceloporus undulatus]